MCGAGEGRIRPAFLANAGWAGRRVARASGRHRRRCMALPSKKAAAADGDYMARLLSASPAVILPLVFVYLFLSASGVQDARAKKKNGTSDRGCGLPTASLCLPFLSASGVQNLRACPGCGLRGLPTASVSGLPSLAVSLPLMFPTVAIAVSPPLVSGLPTALCSPIARKFVNN